ncbi:hypothetical protein [uncultured Thiodictyon sp.]|uniref:hypothetical protein n=1 Tax=uncultured Thiodictyon sp. TaxID=1846217 RepID=UPI0025D48008|nr:hypothetical protein [uncultured Thiodictyon sp.]
MEVWKTGEGCAHYKGIMVCGSIWVCAVCGAKISERRRAELETATGLWRAQGGKVWLLTFTFSHGRFDHLGESLAKLAQARKLMKGGVGYQSIKARCGMVGTVTASEITHGQAHGWHPHIHELAFVSGGDKEAFRSQMYQRWRVSCLRAGLGEPSEKYGFDVRDGEAAAGYISKGLGPDTWGIESEMTKGHIKNGKRGSLSPFQILDCATDPEATPEHREHSRLLFLDYAQSTKGRRQLVWSPGLRDRFAVPELTDEEIASSVGEDSVLLASISLSDWEIIVRHDLLAVVLQLAEEGGADAVYRLIGFYR